MSCRICKAEIYGFRDKEKRKQLDYIIMSNYDGKFLEWTEVNRTGIKEIDQNIGCDGSVVVHKTSHAQKIIDNL